MFVKDDINPLDRLEDRVLRIMENSHQYPTLKQLSIKNRVAFFWTLPSPCISDLWISWSIFHLKENETYLVRRVYWVRDSIFATIEDPNTFGCDAAISIDLVYRIVNAFPKSKKTNSSDLTNSIIFDGINRRAIILNEGIDYRWWSGEENHELYDHWLEENARLLNKFMPVTISKY